MIRVLLAEDQALVRDGIAALLDLEEGLTTTAVADGREAVDATAAAAAAGAPFDVAVLDVRMPGMDGIAATRALKAAIPHVPVLILTTFDERELVERCVNAGADAFMLKDAHPADLARAIRWLVEGRLGIPGDLAHALRAAGDAMSPGASSQGVGAPEPLTPAQRRVLALIADGRTNGEIAERLGLTMGTVKNVVSEVYARLGVRDRVGAVLKVRRGDVDLGGVDGHR
jgi:DNA-binding NarL/FixJ family response regulator